MSSLICPGCYSGETIRTILNGIPLEEPDPNDLVIGSSSIEEDTTELKCIKCGWHGPLLDVEKATRYRRFIWTDEDAPGIYIE